MSTLQNDPDIRDDLFGLEEKLTIQQVRFMGERMRDLLNRYHSASREVRAKPKEWAEWSTFINAAYSCGFVCHDGREHMGDREETPVPEFMRRLEGDPGLVDTLCLRDLRRILHYVMRSERWGDGGADTRGGALWGLITSRLGEAIAHRLAA